MNRKNLLTALTQILPGVDKKKTVESLSYFYLSRQHIISYNNKISIRFPLQTDFSAFIKANDLFNLVSKASADEVLMKKDGDKVKIKIGKVQGTLATIEDEEFTVRLQNVSESLEGVKWMKLPDTFEECVLLCAFAASKSESEGTLTCVRISGVDATATDNSRIAHAKMSSEMKPLFLKASEVKSLLGINPTHYAGSKAWLHFKNEDGCVFSIRKVKGEFPDCLPMFDFEGTEVTIPKEVLEGVDIASIFIDDSTPSISINISANKCVVTVESEAGNIKHSSDINYKGKEINFKINPDFFNEMMKHSTTLIVSDDKAKLSTENFSLVVCLYQS